MIEISMPSMGADMTEGVIVKWLVTEGSDIKRGDKIAEIETDKTIVPMEAFSEGVLRKIVAPEGATVKVGKVIALIGDVDEEIPADIGDSPTEEPEKDTPKSSATSAPSHTNKPESKASVPEPTVNLLANGNREEESEAHIKASPMARRLAKERGIADITEIKGTGPNGRITRDDVLAHVPMTKISLTLTTTTHTKFQLPSGSTPLSSMRRAIARVTSRSKREAPHFYVTVSADMTTAVQMRVQLNTILADSGSKVSLNDMVLFATVKAIVKYPKWNATFTDTALENNPDINLGVAIAVPDGLVVPAVLGAQNMNLEELSSAVKDLGKRARIEQSGLTQGELTKGTFSTSNMGMFGIDSFSAIIVPPQSAILAISAVKAKPVVDGSAIVVRQMMNLTLSADHRVGDGAEAALFINEVKHKLENPLQLLT